MLLFGLLASLKLAGIAQHAAFFLGAGQSTATIDLVVARTFQPVSAFTKHTVVFAVSS